MKARAGHKKKRNAESNDHQDAGKRSLVESQLVPGISLRLREPQPKHPIHGAAHLPRVPILRYA